MALKNSSVYRVISGICNISFEGKIYQVRPISPFQKYLAEEYYDRLIDEYSQNEDMQDEVLMEKWMLKNGYWTIEEDDKIEKYKGDIEDFKVRLYELGFREKEKAVLKEAIKKARGNLEILLDKKHKFHYLTVEGAALMAKNKYLMGISLYYDEKPLFGPTLEFFLSSEFPFLDNIILEYNKKSLTTEDIRAMARSDVWRKYWCGKECESVFGKPSIELNDEQLNLLSWTRVYDNVYQHPDCPSDEVIEDDDCLDGFLIWDKRRRDKDKGISEIDKRLKNPKLREAQELFLMADTKEDAKKIQELNDEETRQKIRNRDKLIEEKGVVQNLDFSDVKRDLQLQLNQKSLEIMRSRKG